MKGGSARIPNGSVHLLIERRIARTGGNANSLWEWAEQPDYPRDRSDYAFKLGVNFVLYAMTH